MKLRAIFLDSTHNLRDAHLGPLAVEARLAGRAEPAGRGLAQARVLVAPCNKRAQPPFMTLVRNG